MRRKSMFQKAAGLLLAIALAATSVPVDGLAVKAAEEKAKVNFALDGTATANDTEENWTAEKAIDGVINRGETVKADQSRWSTHKGTDAKVLTVDLGEKRTFDEFKIAWERKNITGFDISVSDTENGEYTPVYDKPDAADIAELDTVIKLETPAEGRFVKLNVDGYNGGDLNWASVSIYEFEILGEAEPPVERTNLALNKNVTATNVEAGNEAAKAVDGNDQTRWATNQIAGPQSLTVDLGSEQSFEQFEIAWERENVTKIDISVSATENGTYESVHTETFDDHAPLNTIVTLAQPATGQFVKLTIEYDGGELQYESVSLYEFEIWNVAEGEPTEPGDDQDPQENVALHKTAVASSEEADTVRAELAVDGDNKSQTSRWGSNTGAGPHWIYVDLGKEMNVQTVKIFWETRKATSYKVQVATELAENADDTVWTNIKESADRPTVKNEKIELADPVRARYVRLYVDNITATDPDGGVEWNTISIYEMEVYGGILEVIEDFDTIKEGIVVTTPAKGDTQLKYTVPESAKYEVAYNGTDYEQVIDADGTIYQPVVDTTVKVSFKITEKATGEYEFKEVPVTVPGQYTQEANDNAAPEILPELREWKGHTGNFTPSASSRIVIADTSLQEMAEEFKADYKDITGKDIEIVNGSEAADGDFFFKLTDASKGLKDEGYLMTVDANVTVEAEDPTGAYWATRTILQSLKLTGNIPCGIARDYPLYRVRGYILDVGRKTFTLDYLKQIVKEMSWYKLNDFHVHLNDNLIFLEDYAPLGKDPMTAYSGFRLESDIKKGDIVAGGEAQADLTSTDMFYTKDEFRDFIKESRVQGVNIVPEFDSPAHALALTKVRPDLRHSPNARDNEHLALNTKYNECLDFVQTIFGEYMTEENPVFDKETTLHIGADEYSAGANAYRNFVNDMAKFVQDSGRTVRVWGSLTWLKGDGTVEVRGDYNPENRVQINLWNGSWANREEMYDLGFDLIYCNDGALYIVPNSGYYHPNGIGSSGYYNADVNGSIPDGDEQVAGAAFALWNDQIDIYANGVSEYDVYELTKNGFPMLGARLWGKGTKTVDEADALRQQLGSAPNTNFGYEVPAEDGVIAHETFEAAENAVNAEVETVDGKKALKLNGGESYAETGLETVGLGNDLRVKVKRTSDSKDEQILFESAYGTIKAVQKETGKVGFSREGYDYSFDYTLPVNEWVELEFKNELHVTKLYVNGELRDVLGDDETVKGNGSYINALWSTLMFPVERIGSKTNAFEGYVDDLRIGTDAEFNSTMALDLAAVTANTLLKENEALKPLLAEAEEIFAKFAPAAEEINALTEKIEAEIEKTEFDEADYSRVEAYLDIIPDNMSAFTEKSVERLEKVIASIRYGLPAAMQSTVDGFELMIAEAIAALEVKTESNVNYVPSSQLTATADSQQGGGEGAAKAIDGNKNTMWHTQYDNLTMPHWIDLESETPMAVNGLTYVPRQSGENGILTEYKVQVSDNGTDYTDIATGTLAKNNDTKLIEFDTVNTKHIRLVFVKSVGNFGSAAEIMLHKADVAADFDGLNEVIANAKAIENKGYTNETWTALQNKIAEAEALAGNEAADANDVEIMKRELADSMKSLVLAEKEEPEVPEEADKTALNKVIEAAKALEEDNYTAETWANLQKALKKAQEVSADKEATEKEVSDAAEALQSAIDALAEKEEPEVPEEADKTALNSVIEKAKKLDGNKYTAETWAKVQTALKNAQKVSADKEATEKEVSDAAEALQSAIDALKEKDTTNPPKPPVEEDKPNDNGNNSGNNGNNGNSGNSGNTGNTSGNNSAQTGDNAMTGLYAALVIAAAGIFVTLIFRKRSMNR